MVDGNNSDEQSNENERIASCSLFKKKKASNEYSIRGQSPIKRLYRPSTVPKATC